MSTSAISTARRGRRWSVITSDLPAATAHYASLVIAAVVLVALGRNQWFDFDEWAWIWDPQVELWAGHVGHWSTLPILVWTAIQKVFGLGSYLPFLAVALGTHLLTAHLLWRLLGRLRAEPWISTGLTALFLLLGAAAQNIFWAFQFAYIGAIAMGVGMVLLSMRERLSSGTSIWIAVLALAGVMTAGTIIPFMAATALILWRRTSFLKSAATFTAPAAAYAAWVLLVAGPGPQDGMRATGDDILLIPQFAGAMLVNGLGTIAPLPYVGALAVAGLGLTGVWWIRSGVDIQRFAAISLGGSAVLFALMTAYSRWNLGLNFAASGRYVYFLFVLLAPLIALIVTQLVRGSVSAVILTLAVIGVFGVYNVGLLITAARTQSATELRTREVITAALDLRAAHPEGVDTTVSPFPASLPQTTLAALEELHEREGLERASAVSTGARLTALMHVGISMTRAPTPSNCATVSPGTTVGSDTVLFSEGLASLAVVAVADGQESSPRTLTLEPGAHHIHVADGTPLRVISITGAEGLCSALDSASTTQETAR